jgi:cell pole-organizing protein PopZ
MEDILASIRRILSEDEAPAPSASASPEHPSERVPEPSAPGSTVLLLDEAMLVHGESPPATHEPAPEPPPMPFEATEPQVAHSTPASRQPDPFDDFDPPAPPADPFDAAPEPSPAVELPAAAEAPPAPELPEPPAMELPDDAAPPLLAPEVAEATVSSVGSLMRQLAEERASPVYRGGPTIEDVVRQEMQPLLTQWVNLNMGPVVGHMLGGALGPLVREWLDLNLAPMTERVVAVEMRPLLKEWLDRNLPPMVERLVRTELERLMARAVR